MVNVSWGERNVEFHHQPGHGQTEVHHGEGSANTTVGTCERNLTRNRRNEKLASSKGFDIPVEKGAQADFSLIISGYRYQRSGMNLFACGYIASSAKM